MDHYSSQSADQLERSLSTCRQLAGIMQRQVLEVIAACDERALWRNDGCRDAAQWVAGRFGISNWAARRWIHAAHALGDLPQTARALSSGRLSFDKVLELTRFATPESEAGLIKWAAGVLPATIRHRADLAQSSKLQDVGDDHAARFLRWWPDDSRMWLEGMLPAEQGTLLVRAIERLAAKLPRSPEDDEAAPTQEARRADALFMMATAQTATDPEPDRATVIVHAPLAALCSEEGSCEIEGSGVIHPEVARMLGCDARIQTVLEDPQGHAVGVGRVSRNVPHWLRRLLHERDRGCTFPGCEHKRYVKPHHIAHWSAGGPTDLDNLVLVCPWHHALIHKHKWRVALGKQAGTAYWFRPDNQPYEPTRAPPARAPSLN